MSEEIIAVLEQSDRPLPYWDIERHLENDYFTYLGTQSLLNALRSDPRVCWGGKGVYGLYRHGLLPGVADLGSVAAIYVYVSGCDLHYGDIWFAMQHAGYTARRESVYYGLRRALGEGLVKRDWWGDWLRPRPAELPRSRIEQMLGTNARQTREILARTSEQLTSALAEQRRRLYGHAL